MVAALLRAYQQTRTSGSLAVVAEAKEEAARRCYLKHGFAQLGSERNRLYLPMAAIRLLSSAAK